MRTKRNLTSVYDPSSKYVQGFSSPIRAALKILWQAYSDVVADYSMPYKTRTKALYALAGAVRAITYPYQGRHRRHPQLSRKGNLKSC